MVQELVQDDRFKDVQEYPDGGAQVVLYAGYESEMRDIITDEYGLEIVDEELGHASGNTIAQVETHD